MSEPREVGAALKLLRERAGLTQRELAERLDVQQPAVARWEAGGVRIPVNRIEQIVAELGYGLEYDLKAVPIGEALQDGIPVQLVRRGPAVNEDLRTGLRVRSGAYDFSVNPAQPWLVDMWEVATGEQLPGAFAVYPERIERLVAHPDGVLVRFGHTVGKITPNAKRRGDGSAVFTYSLANRRDLELAGVSREPTWTTI